MRHERSDRLSLFRATWRGLVGLALTLSGYCVPAYCGNEFTFSIDGTTFTYSDAQRSFTGQIFIPAGQGPFPAIVFNHGQGGSPQGYPNLSIMAGWGAVVIAPTLTHVLGGSTEPISSGHCPENLARGLATIDAVASLAYVDPTRIAFFGHSKGAYATIGQVAQLGDRVRVAGMTAGGIVSDAFGVNQAAPTASEALGATAPFIMFHGDVDDSVPPERSLAYFKQLQAQTIPGARIVYSVTSLPPNVQHNLHQDPTINADLLTLTHAWFTQWGLFEELPIFANGFDP